MPLIGKIYTLGASYSLSAPFPQPSSTIVTISMTMMEPASQEHIILQPAVLKDILGNSASIAQIKEEK